MTEKITTFQVRSFIACILVLMVLWTGEFKIKADN